MEAPTQDNEPQRLAALKEYKILDTDEEQSFNDIVLLATSICKVPIAMVSLVDETRQWFKAKVGVTQRQTPRDVAFCAHAILQHDPLIVTNALKDSRFADSTLVTREPHIRFYAGFPLIDHDGLSLGTLCALDHKSRRLSASQRAAMSALSRQVMALLELKRVSVHLAEALEKVRTLHGLLPICAWCKRIRDDEGYWSQVDAYLRAHSDLSFTHGICPDCFEKERVGQETE